MLKAVQHQYLERVKMVLTASIGLHPEETTKGWQTQRQQESLVRGGPTPSHMTIPSPIWVITTTAEIQLGLMIKCGASLLTQSREPSNVQFPFARLSKCSTSPLTTTGNLMPIIPSRTPPFRKKTSLLRSQYAWPSWWNSGALAKVLHYSFFLTAERKDGYMSNCLPQEATPNSQHISWLSSSL